MALLLRQVKKRKLSPRIAKIIFWRHMRAHFVSRAKYQHGGRNYWKLLFSWNGVRRSIGQGKLYFRDPNRPELFILIFTSTFIFFIRLLPSWTGHNPLRFRLAPKFHSVLYVHDILLKWKYIVLFFSLLLNRKKPFL